MKQAKCRAFMATMLLFSVGCKDLSQPLQAGTQNPEEFKTRNGALGLYRGALLSAQTAFLSYMGASGKLTDELKDPSMYVLADASELTLAIDDRREYTDTREDQAHFVAYQRLHAMRNNAMQAIQSLRKYAPDSSAYLQAELHALQGYAEVMLAEGYCSGIPLSTVDFENDYTYEPGLSTQDVMLHAIAAFDTAVALSGDSIRISYFARIGKARALTMLDSIQAAAGVVSGIPENYQYALPIGESRVGYFLSQFPNSYGVVANLEGQNGLPFITSKDPRSASYAYAKAFSTTDSLYLPQKFNVPTDQLGVVAANGIEARLIRAEADLRAAGGQWLAMLNALRTDGTYVTSGGADTTWNAGTGGVAGLRRLQDPGTRPLPAGKSAADVRIDLLFTERAYWLFLTGHRQGDLRRLLRAPYERDVDSLYPIGAYGPFGTILGFLYGDMVVFPVPKQERQLNPRYHGCLSLEA